MRPMASYRKRTESNSTKSIFFIVVVIILFVALFSLHSRINTHMTSILDTTAGNRKITLGELDVINNSRNTIPLQRSVQSAELSLSKDIWAEGTNFSPMVSQELANMSNRLSQNVKTQLYELCGRCLYHTLLKSVQVRFSHAGTFVATGDIPDQWIRDSSVQLSIYLPRIKRRPVLRRIVETAIQRQAFYILVDPYANSFRSSHSEREKLRKSSRQIGRGGWIATRNFELDSSAYFFHLLYSYYTTPGLFNPQSMLADTLIHDAIMKVLETWKIEQHHEQQSLYRYAELPRDGLGPLSGYTGMVWSGYRPSDDAQMYGYNVPDNMYAAGSLLKVIALNEEIWQDSALEAHAKQLFEDIRVGIEKHGVVIHDGQRVYAYEVDGLGNATKDFDDPNVPGLLAVPLLGYPNYDPAIYEATRERLLSTMNRFYFKSSVLMGLGSPHTPSGFVWPLGLMVQALTSKNASEAIWVLETLLNLQCGNGLMHESVNVNGLSSCTRPIFEWANAMLVVAVEQLLGMDCDQAAEDVHTKSVAAFEAREPRVAVNGGQDNPKYYSLLEADIAFAAGI